MICIKPEPTAAEIATEKRLKERHFPGKVSRPGDRDQEKQRDCAVCSSRKGKAGDCCPAKRVRSSYECGNCNVGLCVFPCFDIYHPHADYRATYFSLYSPRTEQLNCVHKHS